MMWQVIWTKNYNKILLEMDNFTLPNCNFYFTVPDKKIKVGRYRLPQQVSSDVPFLNYDNFRKC